MKLKVRQRKKSKKAHKLYRVVHQLKSPYRVFIDDSSLEECASKGMSNPKQNIIDMFATIGYKSTLTLCTHTRVLDKLRTEEKMEPLRIGQKLLYVSVKGSGKQSENPLGKDSMADLCARWVEANMKATPDERRCLVATESQTVRDKLAEEYPFVPTLRIDGQLKAFVFDDMIVTMKRKEAHEVNLKALEVRKKKRKGVNPLSNKPKRKKLSLEQAYSM